MVAAAFHEGQHALVKQRRIGRGAGAAAGALDAQADIQLDTPELVEDAVSGSGSALSKAFEIDNGQMAVAIRFN